MGAAGRCEALEGVLASQGLRFPVATPSQVTSAGHFPALSLRVLT